MEGPAGSDHRAPELHACAKLGHPKLTGKRGSGSAWEMSKGSTRSLPTQSHTPQLGPEQSCDVDLLTKDLLLAMAPPPGEHHHLIRDALAKLGFRTTIIERLPTRPVWSIRFAQPAERVCPDVRQLSRVLKRVLKQTGLRTPPGQLSIRLAGRYVILSFISEEGEPGELLGGTDTFIERPWTPEAAPDPDPGYDEVFIGGLNAWPE